MFEKTKRYLENLLKILRHFSLEKLLFAFAALIGVIMLLTQIGLVSSTFRPYLTDVDVFEGYTLNKMDSLIKEGKVKLLLVDMNKEEDVKILINGNVVGFFDTKEKELTVRNNAIVEVDGCDIKTPFRVRIISQSDNIKSDLINREITIRSNIEFLCRIKLK